ncbi:hypothetical protein, partial [Burkholderia cenocepacia]|uniref:hypothetical protein n=1 Tax=Burkholderia cenocepacia TaxID=95486 RepID=UPI001955AA8A
MFRPLTATASVRLLVIWSPSGCSRVAGDFELPPDAISQTARSVSDGVWRSIAPSKNHPASNDIVSAPYSTAVGSKKRLLAASGG